MPRIQERGGFNPFAGGQVTQTTPQGDQGFDMDLLMYFLSGAGKSLSEEGSLADVMGGMTQQQIRAKSQMKLIQQLLAGGGKLNMDKEKMNISAPMSAFKGGGMEDFDPMGGGEVPGGGMTMAPTPTPQYDLLNPSQTLPGIGDVSLAGLTSEDISQAFQLKLGTEEIRRKKLSDLMTYAGAAGKDTRTALQKNYEYAKQQGFEGGIADFKYASETAHMKNYEYYVSQEQRAETPEKEILSFNDWMLGMARAGGINLGDLREREVLKDEIDFEKQITSPDFIQEAEEFVTENQRLEYESAADPGRKKLELTIKQIESKLASDVVKDWNAAIEGDYIVWDVTFKSGRTAKIRMRK